MGEKLTPKQTAFVAEYLANGLNATSAAKSAGYSAKTAESMGSQLLRNIKIVAEIAKRTQKRCEKLELTADRVLEGLANLAFFDIRKFYDEQGNLKSIVDLDDMTAQALSGMEVEEAYEHFGKGQAKPTGVLKKIKIADRGQNLERLGRYFKLFTDKMEVTGLEGLADAIQRARLRAGKK